MGETPPVDPKTAVKNPALGLMAVGGIDALLQILTLGWLAFVVIMQGHQLPAEMLPQLIGQGVGTVIGLACSALLIYAGMQMKELKNHKLCFAASIVACIPCFACCLIGIPVGVWSIITLKKPEVQAAFTA